MRSSPLIFLIMFEYMFCRRDYQRCLHMNALYLPARVNLAYTLQMVGHYQQAWHQFTAAINIDNSKMCNNSYNGIYYEVYVLIIS